MQGKEEETTKRSKSTSQRWTEIRKCQCYGSRRGTLEVSKRRPTVWTGLKAVSGQAINIMANNQAHPGKQLRMKVWS